MLYLVTVDHNGMAAHLTRSDWEWSNAANVRKMKALSVSSTDW